MYIITYKLPVVSDDGKTQSEIYSTSVTKEKAATIKKAWDSKSNFYLGDQYLPWTAIVSITEDRSEVVRIDTQECTKCWKGWISGENGYYPCGCNERVTTRFKEYQTYLNKQEWYLMNQEYERKQEHERRFSDDPQRGAKWDKVGEV